MEAMKFSARQPLFGRPSQVETFPSPIIEKSKRHRTAQLAEAVAVLTILPGEGETLHALMTGRYDLMTLIVGLIGKLGGCTEIRIATLSYNARNLADALDLFDSRAVG